MPQVVLDAAAFADLRAHPRLEEAIGAFPFGLCAVERGVGAGEKLRAVPCVGRVQGNADADRDDAGGRLVRSGRLRDFRRLSASRPTWAGSVAGSDDGELVAAEARQHLTLAQDGRELLGDVLQQLSPAAWP